MTHTFHPTTLREYDIRGYVEKDLSDDFARANQTRWVNFLNKMELDDAQAEDFERVLETIWKFLEHPVQSSIDRTKSPRKWKPQTGWK